MREALNKIDCVPGDVRQALETRASAGPGRARQFPISAATGEGVEALLEAIADYLSQTGAAREIAVPVTDGATIAWLYRNGEVRSRRDEGDLALLTVALDQAASAQLDRRLAR